MLVLLEFLLHLLQLVLALLEFLHHLLQLLIGIILALLEFFPHVFDLLFQIEKLAHAKLQTWTPRSTAPAP